MKVPGLANVWVPPIRNRIDMLATGIKSPIGVKVSGSDLAEIDRIARDGRRGRQEGAGRHLGARRAADRRALYRRRYRSRRRGALRPQHRRCAVDRRRRHRRRDRSARRSRVWRATRSASAIRANCATASASCENLPILTPSRQQITLGTVARGADQRWPADAAQRECAARDLGLCRCPRPRPCVRGRAICSSAVAQRRRSCRPGVSIAYTGQFEYPRPRDRAAEDRRAGHARDHLRPALSDLPPLGRGAADHGDAAVRPDRRAVAALSARLQPVGRDRRRVHRAGGASPPSSAW